MRLRHTLSEPTLDERNRRLEKRLAVLCHAKYLRSARFVQKLIKERRRRTTHGT